MKKSVCCLAFMLLLANVVNSQNHNQLSLQLSINQIEIGYQHELFTENVWAELFTGIGNQDINIRFDDFLAGFRTGFIAFSKNKNTIGFNVGLGIYIPNNNYYNVVTPVVGAGIRYVRFIGKSKQNCLFVDTGYQYGKRYYKQEYSSVTANISTVESFKIAPLYFSVGYGFNF